MAGEPKGDAKGDLDREGEGAEESRAPQRPISVAMSWPRVVDEQISTEPPDEKAA